MDHSEDANNYTRENTCPYDDGGGPSGIFEASKLNFDRFAELRTKLASLDETISWSSDFQKPRTGFPFTDDACERDVYIMYQCEEKPDEDTTIHVHNATFQPIIWKYETWPQHFARSLREMKHRVLKYFGVGEDNFGG